MESSPEAIPLMASKSANHPEPQKSSFEEEHATPPSTSFIKFTFGIAGAAWFILFFCVALSMQPYDTDIFPNRTYPAAAQSAFSYALLVITLLLLIAGRNVEPTIAILVSAYAQLLTAIGFPITAFLAYNTTTGYWITLQLVAIQQLMLGVGLTTTVALAGILSSELPGLVTLGIPVGGLVLFILSTILTSLVGAKIIITVLFGLAAICIIAFLYCIQILFKTEWMKARLESMRSSSGSSREHAIQSAETAFLEPEESIGALGVLKKTAVANIGLLLTIMSLFAFYPAFCITLRSDIPRFSPLIVGLHTVGEVIGRLFVTNGLILPAWTFIPASLARFGFLPLFAYIKTLSLDSFFRSEVFLYITQIFQGATLGWIASSCFIEAPLRVHSDSDKQFAGILTTTFNNLGIPAGTLLFNILTATGTVKLEA